MGTKRGDDAQDHAPRPEPPPPKPAPNVQDEKAGDGAIEVEDMNSANDEGAN